MDHVTVESDFAGWVVKVRVDNNRFDTTLEAIQEAAKILQREVLRNERTRPGNNSSR